MYSLAHGHTVKRYNAQNACHECSMPLKMHPSTVSHVMKDPLPYPVYKYADLNGGLIYA